MKKRYFEINKGKILGFFPKLEDGKYKIVEIKQIRSLDQNRLYFGYILKYIVVRYKEYGYIHTIDELHRIFKIAFVPRVKIKSDFSKKYIWKTGSTTDLNTKQFIDYIKSIEIIMEFGEMDKLGLEKIEGFIIPKIDDDKLLDWIDLIC